MLDPVSLIDRSYNYKTLLWLVVGIIVAFFLWAGLTTIPQQVHGTGRVIPSGKVRSIQHLEGGIVSEIHTAEGKKVNAGDVLFTIINKRAEAELGEASIGLDYLKIKKLRLEAEMALAPEFTLPPELMKKYPEIAISEKKLFDSRNEQFNEKMSGLEERLKQKLLKMSELTNTVRNLKQEAAVADQQLAIKTRLRNNGAISESQYLETQSMVKNFITQIQRTQADIPITQAELAETKNLIEETKKTRQSDVAQEANDVNLDIKRQTERITANKDQVDRTVITSPVKGIVNKIYVNTIGGVVAPGSVLAEVIPIGETLVVEGKIATNDRGKIWLGLPVVMKVTAYDYSTFGGIKGELTHISADSFIDNRNNEFYQVRVTLDADKLSDSEPIYPGMTVNLNIVSSKVSVLRSILKPLWNIKDEAMRER